MPETDLTFTTPSGQTIDRGLMVAYLNTGETSTPTWYPIGKRVESADREYDWSQESLQDILGNTWTTMKKPIMTDSYDPIPLDAGDAAAVKLWNLGVKDQNAQALTNQDMLIAHYYTTGNWAERYSGCAVAVTKIGGDGGGNLEIGFDVTYGGTRTLGTVKNAAGTVTFAPDETT